MNSKSNPNLDLLVKRIYSFYIDIKSGDFKEIDKDILLGDIGALYSAIKEMYGHNSQQISDFESSLIKEKSNAMPFDLATEHSPPVTQAPIQEINTSPVIETPIEVEPVKPAIIEELKIETPIINTPIVEEIQIPELIIESASKTTVYFSDDFEIEDENIAKNIPTTIETPKIEEPIIPNPPVEEKKTSFFDKFKSIPSIIEAPAAKLESKITEVTKEVVETKVEPIIKPIVEVEKEAINIVDSNPILDQKSTGKIMDFLHDGDQKTSSKDIYSFLDINTRIGLVELFFKGNSMELTDALVKINKMTSKADCMTIVNKYAQQFKVEETEDIYQSFSQLIDRKFS